MLKHESRVKLVTKNDCNGHEINGSLHPSFACCVEFSSLVFELAYQQQLFWTVKGYKAYIPLAYIASYNFTMQSHVVGKQQLNVFFGLI